MSAARSTRDGRHRARVAALQLLYLREVGGGSAAEVADAVARYWGEHPAPPERRRRATALFEGTVEAQARIDPLIEEAAEHWRLSRMAVVDRLAIRMGVFELLRGETPPAVVLDEAIELVKAFGGDQSVRFVNGVLDAVRRRLDETGEAGGGRPDPASAGVVPPSGGPDTPPVDS